MKIVFALLAVLAASQVEASVIKNNDDVVSQFGDKGLLTEVRVNTEESLEPHEAVEGTKETVERFKRLKRQSCGPYGCAPVGGCESLTFLLLTTKLFLLN